MNLVDLQSLYNFLPQITDQGTLEMVMQAIIANVPDMLNRLRSPQVVIAAQDKNGQITHFGPFRDVNFVGNQIMVNGAIRAVGSHEFDRWRIGEQSFKIISVEAYRPDTEHHQNLQEV